MTSCEYCHAPLPGLLAECDRRECAARQIDRDIRRERAEEDNR